MDGKTVLLDQSRLHVVDQGAGTPVLLVHGFPLDHQMWNGQIEFLAGSHRVIAPDLRGFGRSSSASNQVSIKQHADEMAALLDALSVDKAVFCGLSMGGYIGWEFWRHHPDRLSGLIACDTRVTSDTIEIARGRRMMAESLTGAEPKDVVERKIGLIAESLLPKLFARSTFDEQPRVVENTRTIICETRPESIAMAQIAMSERSDFSNLISGIKIPVMVVCGLHDSITPPDEMRGIVDQIPAAEYFQIENAGHLSPLEQPAEFNRCISRFLRRIS